MLGREIIKEIYIDKCIGLPLIDKQIKEKLYQLESRNDDKSERLKKISEHIIHLESIGIINSQNEIYIYLQKIQSRLELKMNVNEQDIDILLDADFLQHKKQLVIRDAHPQLIQKNVKGLDIYFSINKFNFDTQGILRSFHVLLSAQIDWPIIQSNTKELCFYKYNFILYSSPISLRNSKISDVTTN